MPFGMSPDLQRYHQEVNIDQWHEILFVQHLVDGEQVCFGMAGPVEFSGGLVDEVTLERF